MPLLASVVVICWIAFCGAIAWIHGPLDGLGDLVEGLSSLAEFTVMGHAEGAS